MVKTGDHLVDILTNETVIGLRLGRTDGGREFLSFLLANGREWTYELYGDCCSESWVYTIQNVRGLLDNKIQAVVPIPEVELADDGRGRQDRDILYRYTFVTSKGYTDLEFRNSSNGYYGGSLDHIHWRDLPNDATWQQIESDYLGG
jgi:hypothetical protein